MTIEYHIDQIREAINAEHARMLKVVEGIEAHLNSGEIEHGNSAVAEETQGEQTAG